MRLLIVEDNAELSRLVAGGLAAAGYQSDIVGSAAEAREAVSSVSYAAMILDLGLPDGDGLSVLRELRLKMEPLPVLVLTARGQLSDRIRGLDAGADDYLVKPFQLGELLARVRAVARRSEGLVVPTLRHGDVVLDPVRRRVTKADEPVSLSAYEYRMLLTLLQRAGHVVTRDELEKAIYGDRAVVGSNTVSVFVHQLRRKLGDELIATVHGHGYTLGGAP